MQFEGVLIKTNSQEVGQAHMHVQSTSRPITQTFRGNRVIEISKQKTGRTKNWEKGNKQMDGEGMQVSCTLHLKGSKRYGLLVKSN